MEERTVHFSQLGDLQEGSLKELREQIKKVMIPLLIKTFQSQIDSPEALQEEIEQLKSLDRDLYTLQQWCQSCRSQIHKALSPPEEERKSFVTRFTATVSPAAVKSWWKILKK